jgi:hypothetical protein
VTNSEPANNRYLLPFWHTNQTETLTKEWNRNPMEISPEYSSILNGLLIQTCLSLRFCWFYSWKGELSWKWVKCYNCINITTSLGFVWFHQTVQFHFLIGLLDGFLIWYHLFISLHPLIYLLSINFQQNCTFEKLFLFRFQFHKRKKLPAW